ncbi:MAG: 30S ribosomal protein S8 [bacterium]|nr:30S ribosomal protein S8 [bacterium]
MTYVTDPIGDFLTRMRNAQAVNKRECRAPHSRMKVELSALLKKEGWITDYREEGEVPKKEVIVVFAADKPRLTLSRESKPGRRLYKGYQDLHPVLNGFGAAILSTSKGMMTDKQAREKHLGGEVLCTIS